MAPDQVAQAPSRQAGAAAERAASAFSNPDFVKLWAGQTVSLIGTQVTQFTMPLVAILTLNATVLEVGVLNALRFVPVLLLSLFAGVWLDRRRRRPVLIACALGNAVLIGLVPIASVTGLLSIGLLYVVVTLAGLLSMIFDVGALSYVPNLVDREHLTEANSKLQASTAFAGIAGPGLAGVLVGLITAPITLTADSVSYLFSAAGLIAIRKPEPAPDVPEVRASVRRSIAEGLRAVCGSKLLSALLTQGAALNLFFGAYITVFVVYAVRVRAPAARSSWASCMAGSAVGSLAGATTARRVTQGARARPDHDHQHGRGIAGPAPAAGAPARQRGRHSDLRRGPARLRLECRRAQRQRHHPAADRHAQTGARPDERDVPHGALRRRAHRDVPRRRARQRGGAAARAGDLADADDVTGAVAVLLPGVPAQADACRAAGTAKPARHANREGWTGLMTQIPADCGSGAAALVVRAGTVVVHRRVPSRAPRAQRPQPDRLRGQLDVAALERALGALVARHEPLRTRLAAGTDGHPVQVIDPAAGRRRPRNSS